MGWFKNSFGARVTVKLEVQFIDRNKARTYFDDVFHDAGATVQDVDLNAENTPEGMRYTNVYTIEVPRSEADCRKIREDILQNRDVCSVRLV